MKGLDMYGFKKRTLYRRQDHEDQIHEEQRHFDLKTFYQSQVKLWSVTHSFTRYWNNIKLMRIWLMQILDNRLSRYCCWCCWGKCCWLFMRRCCVTKKEVASLWKMMCDVRAVCVTQGELVWLNDTSFRSLSALGNVCGKSIVGDFDSDQSMHFFIMTGIA